MASKYLQKFPIPEAFPDILHDYAREVLRDQPQDIIEFSIGYFTALESVGAVTSRDKSSTTLAKERRSLLRRTADLRLSKGAKKRCRRKRVGEKSRISAA